MSKIAWNVERIERDGPLHGEIASMGSSMLPRFDDPWMWRLMLGRHVVDFGRAEFRHEAIADMFEAWVDWDERLDAA